LKSALPKTDVNREYKTFSTKSFLVSLLSALTALPKIDVKKEYRTLSINRFLAYLLRTLTALPKIDVKKEYRTSSINSFLASLLSMYVCNFILTRVDEADQAPSNTFMLMCRVKYKKK